MGGADGAAWERDYGAPERRTVAGQQSGVSAIEAIEKAMEGVTHGDWYLAGKLTIRHTSPVGGTDGWIGKVNWRNGEANARYIAATRSGSATGQKGCAE